MRSHARFLSVFALGAFAVACGDDASTSGGEEAQGTTTMEGAEEPIEEGPTIDGVQLIAVMAYQGVKRELSIGDEIAESTVPLITGRDTMFRVYYTAEAEVVGEPITAVLSIEGQEPISLETTIAAAGPNEADINTTINFEVDGARIGPTLEYKVEIFVPGSPTVSASYPRPGGTETHTLEGAQQVIKIVLVPYQYGADGSNRLPDTSEAAVAAYRERFLQLYPVSDVQISVHTPVPWGQELTAFGGGWQQLMQNISQLRIADGVSPETYYYGIANPADTFQQFCGFGCLLGVTALNAVPADTGNPSLRWAVGIGYLEYATDTAVHEIGHSHGREHVNCGQGLDPNSIDNAYPHATNSIGVWGWDIVNGGLKEPGSHTDYMGYCMNQWTSDYTYTAMFNRGRNVNQAALPPAPGPGEQMTLISLDGEGKGEWMGELTQGWEVEVVDTVSVSVTDIEGKVSQVEGTYYPLDHLPGGWLLLPGEPTVHAQRVELELAGVHSVVER